MELIGRHRERLDVVDRLRRRRLVTLIGPAGIGKTAVAEAVARQVGPDFALGTHRVDLTRVDSAEAVAGAIAAQLGFGSFDALVSSPSEQPALVVVDNCEHVTDAAADAVAELLAACESPTVLATSRSPLGVPGESLMVLGPLEVPLPGQADAGCDAVRLFLERARDAGAGLDEGQLAIVSELCRRLDGLPLALELAAARTRMLRPAEILDRLGEGVDVLARPRFRGAKRHRSLAATIEWSYRLLPDGAAALFDRLGLLAGPFPADLAHALAADTGLDREAAGDALQLLVDSSLVVAEPAADQTTFRLLQTVRMFAVERLRERGDEDEARGRLADHVVTAAAELLAGGGRRWEPATFTRLLNLYDTIASSLRWCLDHDDEPARPLMLCAVLWGMVHQGRTDAIAELADATIERWPDRSLPFAADAVATAATARCILGDPAGALDLAERTLAHAEPSRTAPVTLRRAMAYSARALHDRPLELRLATEVSELARDRGLLALALEADVTRAQLLADDDLDAGLARAEAARREAAAGGSMVNEVWAQSVIANLLLVRDIPTGLPAVHEALSASRRIDYPAAISVNLRSLAWAALRTGATVEAARVLSELFDSLVARRGVADLRGALHTTAELLCAAGDEAWAPLAATAASLPLVGLTGSAVDARVTFPPHDEVAPLSRREAITLARASLRRLLDRPAGPAVGPLDRPHEPAAGPPGRFLDRGDFWEVEFAGRAVHVKTSKGVADLARLLRSPGKELHCLDLMGAGVEQSTTGEAIDGTARRDYERRILDLQSDLEEAEAHHDPARAARVQAELDTLVEHLTAALGLGGRDRRTGGSTERARSAVTQRLRATVRRIGRDHPDLGRHLESSVTTGIYCTYRPVEPVDWRL